MDTPVKNLNKEEKENVLMVLNEFTEEYKMNAKSVDAFAGSVKELSEKLVLFLERPDGQESEDGSFSKLEASIKTGVEKITSVVHDTSIPADKLNDLLGLMEKHTLILKNPVPQKFVHHHYIPKITWIAAGLFLIVVLAGAGWYMTADKLDRYIANDTKYRYLKLDTANIYLQSLLYRVDSLSRNDALMRNLVINKEEEFRHNFELLQKANHINAEAENLKADAKKLKEKAGKK